MRKMQVRPRRPRRPAPRPFKLFFRTNVHDVIRHSGWTFQRLGAAINVKQSTLRAWTVGANRVFPDDPRLRVLAALLNVPLADLFDPPDTTYSAPRAVDTHEGVAP